MPVKKPQKGKGKKKGFHDGKFKGKPFKIFMKLICTGEQFNLPEVYTEMTISDLKDYCEFMTGMPCHIQRIRYLDDGDLLDDTTLRDNEIVPLCIMTMAVWPMWTTLIQAIAFNDLNWLLKLGVHKNSNYKTPNLEYTFSSKRKDIYQERGVVALYIAAHRGRGQMCEALHQLGVDINGQTPLGRTALHVAAAMDHGHIIDLLLANGADINAEDHNGHNALSIASRFGHKGCERHLFMFRWQERAKNKTTEVYIPDFAFQKFDSSNPVWLKGPIAQVYVTSDLLPPGEYQGSALSSPQSTVHLNRKGKPHAKIQEEELPRVKSAKSADDTLAFSNWLAKKVEKEQAQLAVLREQKREEKQQQEDKRKKAELEELEAKKDKEMKAIMAEKSYEQWLLEQEAVNKKQKKDAKVHVATGGKSTKDVIQSLLMRKQAEADYQGIPFEIWSAERTGKTFGQIKIYGDLLQQHYQLLK